MFRVSISQGIIKILPLGIVISILLSVLLDKSIILSISFGIAISMLISYSKNIYENFSVVFFTFTFMFFVLGSEIPNIIFNLSSFRNLGEDVDLHYHISIFLSLIGLLIGYQIKRITRSDKFNIEKITKDETVISIRYVAKKIFYFTFWLYILPVLERSLYVRSFSYYESYISYQTAIPYIFIFIGNLCPIAFSLYLATFPEKNDCRKPIIMYMIYAVLYLFTGKRYLMVSSILFLITYLLIRNKTDFTSGIVWIKKRTILFFISLLPLLGIALAAYSTIRVGADLDSNTTIYSLIVTLFTSVADTDKVIKYGYILQDFFPEGHVYSIGNIIDYFKFGTIAKVLFDNTVIVSQTVEYAMEGNNFSYTLSYLYYPTMYLSGHGLGSCYIAELYQDAGYLGILLGNILIGILLRNLFVINNVSVWRNAFVIYTYRLLLLVPRSSFDVIFREVFAISYILSVFIIFILIKKHKDIRSFL